MMENIRERKNEPVSVTAGENELKSNLLLFLSWRRGILGNMLRMQLSLVLEIEEWLKCFLLTVMRLNRKQIDAFDSHNEQRMLHCFQYILTLRGL